MSRIWDFWAKRYDKLWTQQLSLIPTRQKVIRELQKIIVDKDKEYKILDMSCGIGQLIYQINEIFHGYQLSIDGVDSSTNMIEIAGSKNRFANISFILEDIETFNAPDQFYDIILCTHALPYHKNQGESIRKFYRWLKNGGSLIIGQASGNNFFDKIVLFFLKLVSGNGKYHSIRRIQALLLNNNFSHIKISINKNLKYMPTIFTTVCKKM